MEVAFLVGRIIVGIFYINSGIHQFTHLKMQSAHAASKGVPAPNIAVAFTGVLLVIGGALIGLGFYPTIGAICILVFLLPTTFMMHNFWSVQDPKQKMSEMVNFTKNWALMGYTLMILAIPQPWAFSL